MTIARYSNPPRVQTLTQPDRPLVVKSRQEIPQQQDKTKVELARVATGPAAHYRPEHDADGGAPFFGGDEA